MIPETNKLLLKRGALLSVLVLTLAACAQPGGAPNTQTGERLGALVHGPTGSAYLEAVAGTLDMTQYDGSQNPDDFDLLIFDGDAHTPDTLKEDALVTQALRTNMYVLALDVTEAHKKEGLGGVLGASSCGFSSAYAVHLTQDANGRPLVQVLEPRSGKTTYLGEGEVPDTHPEPAASPCEERAMTASAVPETNDTAAAFASALVKRVAGSRTDSSNTMAMGTLQVSDPSIPTDLLYTTYQFSNLTTWTVDRTGGAPVGEPQAASTQTNFTFTVFLNNKNNPQGDFQYILADVDATGNPTNGTGYFLAYRYKPSTNWTRSTWSEMGWFQDRLQVHVESPYPDWTTVATSPETVNGETAVTTGVSFSIGFSGKDPSGSFTYSNSVTRTIKDWKITNESSGVNTWWDYRTAYPVDADAGYECGGQQPIYSDGCYMNQDPNDLSMNNMQLHTQTLYRTPSIIDGSVTLNTSSLHRLADLFCYNNGGLWCYEDRGITAENSVSVPYTINLGAVIPIPIASLTFSPNPAKAGATVTGTVTLSKPAQMDTLISLSSNSQNATVLPIVTVKQGQTSANFQVLTSANGISSGSSTAATITAFYAQDFQAQLTVTN